MKIGLLIIGNEILDGKTTDLNTRHLSEFLRINHHQLHITLTVKDSEDSIHLGLKTLFEICDVVVTSGGLGPTLDDVTKQTIASFMQRKIEFSQDAMNVALINYQRFQREFPGKSHGYCQLPENFLALDNPVGFAPGLFTEFNGKYLFCAPGVPREFKSLIETSLLGLIENDSEKKNFIESITVRTKRVPEEKIFNEVDPHLWGKLESLGSVSSLPGFSGVDIGVKLHADSAVALEEKKSEIMKIFKASAVWEHVWHTGSESVEELIVKITREKNMTYGFAESCTGGLCSHRITNVSGASAGFYGSVVCYDNSIKENILGVSATTLKNYGAVSLETASEMAQGLREKFNLDVAISITGIAGPGGGSAEKPVGTVCVGYSTSQKTSALRLQFQGDRELLKIRFSQAALFSLLEEVEKFSRV